MSKIERIVILPKTRAKTSTTKQNIILMSEVIRREIERERPEWIIEEGVAEKNIVSKSSAQVVILFFTMTTNAISLKRKAQRILEKGIGVYVVSIIASEMPAFQTVAKVALGITEFPPDPKTFAEELQMLFYRKDIQRREGSYKQTLENLRSLGFKKSSGFILA